MMLILFVVSAVVFLAKPVNMSPIPVPFPYPATVETYMNFTELVAREGSEYTVERHTALTEDGYLLTVHRLRRADVEPRKAAPVLLMHGIICTSEEFIRMGKNKSLGFLLANEGFDVWLGNFRGNEYSHHTKMDRTNSSYWIYSFHEHGIYDLPAIFDTVQNVTGAARLHYVGYSMGTTSYFVLASARPEVAARVASFTALAPVASINRRLREVLRILSGIGLERTLWNLGIDPVGYNPIIERLLRKICSADIIRRDMCFMAFVLIIWEDWNQMESTMKPLLISKLQPASLRLLGHYFQLGGSGVFEEYDYGREENMKKYGQFEPPKYNLTANKAPTAVFYGKNDKLSPPEEAIRLIDTLKKTSPVVYKKPIPYEMFNHIDFLWAKDIDKLLNNNVVKMVIKFSEKYN